MMAGWHTYKAMQDLDELAKDLGFEIGPGGLGGYYKDHDNDYIVIRTTKEAYPQYNHDPDVISSVYTHGHTECLAFLRGVQWAKEHYKHINLVSDKKIERKNQDCRNRKLLQDLKRDHSRTPADNVPF